MKPKRRSKVPERKSRREPVKGGEGYTYHPLGKYIVSAPGVCGGRPTFRDTRVEVAGILRRLGAGHSIQEIVKGFKGRISEQAVQEALRLSAQALEQQVPDLVTA